MHYEIRYPAPATVEQDAKALRDMRAYVGEKAWQSLAGMFFPPALKRGEAETPLEWIRGIRLACSFAGVSGYPVSAYVRAWIAAYR